MHRTYQRELLCMWDCYVCGIVLVNQYKHVRNPTYITTHVNPTCRQMPQDC